jgi:hypothetical protein
VATSLDTPTDTNISNILTVLAGQGYTWSPLTESFDKYLARALTGIGGSSVSHLTMSRVQLLAGLINALGSGPVSHLTTGLADLLTFLGSVGAPFGPSNSSVALNFATQKYWVRGLGLVPFSSVFTFTRASAETVTDASGAVTYVTTDVPAISSAGYGSTWPAATNLLLNTGDLTNASWTTFTNGTGTISRTANQGVAPDGTTTAAKITINRSDYTSYAQVNQSFTGTAVPYTGSIWIKAFSASDIGKSINVTLYNASSITNEKIVTLTSAWQRVSYTGTMRAAGGCQLIIGYVNSTGGNTSQGSVSFYAWGGQVEIGSAASPYMPAAGSTATRAAPVCTITGLLATILGGSSGSVSIIPATGQRSTAGTLLDANGTVLLGASVANLATTAIGATLNSSNVGAWAYQNNIGLSWDGSGGILGLNGTLTTDAQARTPSGPFKLAPSWNGNVCALVAWTSKQSSPQFGPTMWPGFLPTGTSQDFTNPNPIWPTNTSTPPYRDFANFTDYGSNPITPQNTGTYNDKGVGQPYARANAKIGSTYFALAQASPTSNNNWINLALYTSVSPPLSWTASASNPAITASAGQWDNSYLLHADIIPSPLGDGTLWAYYSAMSAGNVWGIGLAKSDALGTTWTKYGQVISTSGNATNPGLPTVIKIGSTYYLYCCDNGNNSSKIVYFTSLDGITWTYGGVALGAPPSGAWDTQRGAIIDPWVSLNKHGFYELCYTATMGAGGNEFNQRIGYAVSPDGITWTYYSADSIFVGNSFLIGNSSLYEIDGTGFYYLYTNDNFVGTVNGNAKTAADF